MLKLMKRFNKLVLSTLVVTTIGIAATTVSPALLHNETTVSAHAIAADGPWETDTQGTDMIQPVHNGNQIYFSIDPNSAYQKYAKQAAVDWNKLGVVDLVQVPWGDSRIQIQVISDTSQSPNGETGVTEFGNSLTYDSAKNIDYMQNVTITWYNMNWETKVGKQITADHEFGHALGFDHDNRILHNGRKYEDYTLTMNAGGDDDTYALGGIEQRTLAHHYGITPSKWLNTNC